MLNNTQTDYQDAVASVGLGAKQVIFLTMEYDQSGLGVFCVEGIPLDLPITVVTVAVLLQGLQSLLRQLLQTLQLGDVKEGILRGLDPDRGH